jgi:acyl-CoA synthetase (AMP-forming)/AMP-acid ligase II
VPAPASELISSINFPAEMRGTVPSFWRAASSRYGSLGLVKRRGEVELTYGEVDSRSAALARGLVANGAGKGTRIGILMPNGPEWIVAWLAVSRIGAIAVTLSTLFSARELGHVLCDADVAVLLTANTYLRHDYIVRLEDALPALTVAGSSTIAIECCPFLRQIWTVEKTDKTWIRGTLSSLMQDGLTSSIATTSLLSAMEEQVSPADAAIVIYTSGSTAHPKGVVHTQGTIVAKTRFNGTMNTIQPTHIVPADRLVVTPPFFWVGGFLNMACTIHNGGCLICEDDHSPAAMLRAIREEDATHASFTDTMWRTMMQLEGFSVDLIQQLKPINTSQTPLLSIDPDIAAKRYPRAMGMTETFGPHSGEPEARLLPADMAGSVGHALDRMEFKLVDPVTGESSPPDEPGELCVRGPWLMQGIYKRERESVFDRDGFYHTGDLCELRGDGYLFFKSRLGGMIKTSGANVSPEEVEIAIREGDGVLEAAVMGVPDKRLGQMVVAVVAKEAASLLDEMAVQKLVRERLSAFKVPRKVIFCDYDEMPRTPSNKIRKGALLEMFQAELMAQIS